MTEVDSIPDDFPESSPGEIEYELGVPIPGRLLPREQWVQTAIKRLPTGRPIDWTEIFGRSAPVVLDIGCGNGRFIISSAVRRPTVDHIGIDLLPVVIRYATRRGNQRGLSNVRFAVCDGQRFLADLVAPGSLSEMHIYHPQPFHHRQDHRQRLLTPSFLRHVHRSLKASAPLFLQTDSRAYWGYLRTVVEPFFVWQEQPAAWPEDPYGRSRREFIAAEQGLPIYRAIASRRDELDDLQLDNLVRELPNPDFASTAPLKSRKGKRKRR